MDQLDATEGPLVVAGEHDVGSGACLEVLIGVNELRARDLVAAREDVSPAISCRAVVDTGSSTTCVKWSILERLGLEPVGERTLWALEDNAGGSDEPVFGGPYPLFHCSLIIPSGEDAIVATEMPVIGFGIPAYGVILGRDVLSQCRLLWDGPRGMWALLPVQGAADYLAADAQS